MGCGTRNVAIGMLVLVGCICIVVMHYTGSASIALFDQPENGMRECLQQTKQGNSISWMSTATSGPLFSGEKKKNFSEGKRKFQKGFKSKNDDHDERAAWAHKRKECIKWSVTTTISEPTAALRGVTRLGPEWCLVVIGDRKGPETYAIDEGPHGRVIYLNPQNQTDLGIGQFADSLPWNHFSRKNLGYLYAVASGAILIWDFDDDNVLYGEPPDFLHGPETKDNEKNTMQVIYPKAKVNTKPNTSDLSCSSFNPMPLMGSPTSPIWPRGLPLQHLKKQECQPQAYQFSNALLPISKIAIYQSLANKDPDVDAIYRLTQQLPVEFQEMATTSIVVPKASLSPFNAQATLISYSAFFMLLLPATVHSRVSDIWRSYLGGRLLHDIGQRIVFTPPQVHHDRNVHNYLGDFNAEIDLYLKSERLVNFLTSWKCSLGKDNNQTKLTLPGCLEELVIRLYEHDYIAESDSYLFQMWIQALIEVGYKFPEVIPNNEKDEDDIQIKEDILLENLMFPQKQIHAEKK